MPVITLLTKQSRVTTIGILFIIALLTSIMGEFKVYPIESSTFRIGLGGVTFFLLILFTNIRPFYAGITTAFVLLIFRTIIDLFIFDESLKTIVLLNIPASIFYIIYSFGLDKVNLQQLKEFPFRLGLLGAIWEWIANIFEQTLYGFLMDVAYLTWKPLSLLALLALIRSFFVIGIYYSFMISEQKKKIHEIISMQTNLYSEALYMKETMQDVEQITADYFFLYQQLRKENHSLATEALRISSDMHEIKKNTQRINASLSNLLEEQTLSNVSINQLMNYVKETQLQYAHYLKKDVEIGIHGNIDFQTKQYLAILSIIHNIVANAIEAIETKGSILITITETLDSITFKISNDGPPIKPQDQNVLFDPGFTTKFDSFGNPSTGIGLYHVKTIVESMNGTISLNGNDRTTFTVQLDKQAI